MPADGNGRCYDLAVICTVVDFVRERIETDVAGIRRIRESAVGAAEVRQTAVCGAIASCAVLVYLPPPVTIDNQPRSDENMIDSFEDASDAERESLLAAARDVSTFFQTDDSGAKRNEISARRLKCGGRVPILISLAAGVAPSLIRVCYADCSACPTIQ